MKMFLTIIGTLFFTAANAESYLELGSAGTVEFVCTYNEQCDSNGKCVDIESSRKFIFEEGQITGIEIAPNGTIGTAVHMFSEKYEGTYIETLVSTLNSSSVGYTTVFATGNSIETVHLYLGRFETLTSFGNCTKIIEETE